MTADDHDASRPTPGQDPRAPDQPDATGASHEPSSPSATPSPPSNTSNGRGQGTQRKQNSLASLPSSGSGGAAGRPIEWPANRSAWDRRWTEGPSVPSMPDSEAARQVWERIIHLRFERWRRELEVAWEQLDLALRTAGVLDRENYLRVVPPTKGELTCATGVMFVQRSDISPTGFESWPRYCKRPYCEREECAGRSCRLDWLLKKSKQLAAVFGPLPEVWIAVFPLSEREAVIQAAKRSAREAGGRSLRALVHLACADMLIANSVIPSGRSDSRWVMQIAGNLAAPLFRKTEYHFHLDGRTADGKANPCPWRNLPKETAEDQATKPPAYQFNGPDEAHAFQHEYRRLFEIERGFNPELPADHGEFRKHCPEMALQLERDALNHVLRIRDASR